MELKRFINRFKRFPLRYIARQGEHHRKRSFVEEYELFVKRYGLEWRNEGNR